MSDVAGDIFMSSVAIAVEKIAKAKTLQSEAWCEYEKWNQKVDEHEDHLRRLIQDRVAVLAGIDEGADD